MGPIFASHTLLPDDDGYDDDLDDDFDPDEDEDDDEDDDDEDEDEAEGGYRLASRHGTCRAEANPGRTREFHSEG